MLVNSHLLRLFWTAVEETQSQDLLTLSDTALIAVLMQQVSRQMLLSGEEVYPLYEYIGSKTVLVRDIADSRQSRGLNKTNAVVASGSAVAIVPLAG